MIKNITINRSGVNTITTDPVQWSDNLQLAINNGFQITLLEPRLPNIHKSIVSGTTYRPLERPKEEPKAKNGGAGKDDMEVDGAGTSATDASATSDSTGATENTTIDDSEQWKSNGEVNLLNTKEIFDQSTILHTELLAQMDVCKFNKVTVSSDNGDFWFARVSEPTIVKHQWGPISITSKDCYLGVLLNTGELLIFSRGSKQFQDYRLNANLFNIVLKELEIEDASELEVEYKDFLRLKVKDFNFYKVNNDQIITTLNGDNQLVIYNEWFEVRDKVDFEDCVLNYVVSFKLDNYSVGYVTAENEVLVYDSETGVSKSIVPASRFKVNLIKWHKDYLIFTSTVRIFIYNLTGGLVTKPLKSYANVSDLTVIDEQIVISTEIGLFGAFDFKGKECEVPITKSLNEFLSENLMKYQLANNFNNEEITKNYLNLIDGNILNFGFNMNQNGITLTIFKLYPRDNINYTIESKDEFTIGFKPAKGLVSTDGSKAFQTSLSFINKLWFDNFESLLVFPKNIQIASTNFVDKFIEGLIEFKKNIFGPEITPIENSPSGTLDHDFSSYLITNFTMNTNIMKYQQLYNFNEIVISSNDTLITKLKTLKEFEQNPMFTKLVTQTNQLKQEQADLHSVILTFLIQLVIQYTTNQNIEVLHSIDEFLLLGYYSFLGVKPELQLPEKTVEFTTEFFTESFHQSSAKLFTQLAVSESGHSWSRCGLTLFPLLHFNTKTDELGKFHYMIPDHHIPPESLTYQLLTTLNYCIFTGNRLYTAQ